MEISLSFKSYDSKSTLSFTWRDGSIVKRYNGRKAFTCYLPEQPASVAAFEAICRTRFLLGSKWQCTSVVGVAS